MVSWWIVTGVSHMCSAPSPLLLARCSSLFIAISPKLMPTDQSGAKVADEKLTPLQIAEWSKLHWCS